MLSVLTVLSGSNQPLQPVSPSWLLSLQYQQVEINPSIMLSAEQLWCEGRYQLKLQVKVKPDWKNASQRMFFKNRFGGGRLEGGAGIGDAAWSNVMLMMGTKAPSVAGIWKCLNRTETWHLHLIKHLTEHNTGLCRVERRREKRNKNTTGGRDSRDLSLVTTYYLPFLCYNAIKEGAAGCKHLPWCHLALLLLSVIVINHAVACQL